jgi:anti-sigma-K factor RskA
MEMSTHEQERLMNLLADRATQPLSPEELNELKELLEKYPLGENLQLDLAAAAVDLGRIQVDEPLPANLRDKVLADAYQYLDAAPQAPEKSPEKKVSPVESPAENLLQFPSRLNRWQWAGWYVAAACLVLAVTGWWDKLTPRPPQTPLTMAELRERLIAESPDLVKTAWSPTTDESAKRTIGDVVWSNSQQQGFMRFQGLPAIDRSQNEYQLWIFDANQDERYPIDGGVFDVNEATGEVIVRIQAKLKVSQPTLFAITVEKPGGVVVSKRDKLVLVAKVEP